MKFKFLPEFVYGGIDGTITTFAIVTGSIGAGFSSTVILILGFANLLADGFSMAVGNYLSRKSELEQNGRKSIQRPPIKTALATYLSFIFVGVIPLLAYVLALYSAFFAQYQIIISIVFTTAALALIGYIKGVLLNKSKGKYIFETVALGVGASLISYYVGFLIKTLIA